MFATINMYFFIQIFPEEDPWRLLTTSSPAASTTVVYAPESKNQIETLEVMLNTLFEKFGDHERPAVWPQLPLKM